MNGGTSNNPKKLCAKHVMGMNKNLEIYGACRHKRTFHQFFLSTDDTVYQVKGLDHATYFQNLGFQTSTVILLLDIFIGPEILIK